MTVSRKVVLVIVAVILFGVGFLLTVLDEGSAKLFQALLFSGLGCFAAAFLP